MNPISSPRFAGAIAIPGKMEGALITILPPGTSSTLETAPNGDTVTLFTMDDKDVKPTLEKITAHFSTPGRVHLGIMGHARKEQNRLVAAVATLSQVVKSLPEGTMASANFKIV